MWLFSDDKPNQDWENFLLVNNIHKYSNCHVDIMYSSQTTSLKLWKLENKLLYRYMSGSGMATAIGSQILIQEWRTESTSCWERCRPSAISHLQGFLSGREQICPKSYIFPGWTASHKILSRAYKGLALLLQMWAALKGNFIFRAPIGIPPR